MNFEQLQTLGSFKEAIFESNNIIRGVSLLGAESKNRRRYEQDGMRAALPLYDGVKCFINHQTGRGQDWVLHYLFHIPDMFD